MLFQKIVKKTNYTQLKRSLNLNIKIKIFAKIFKEITMEEEAVDAKNCEKSETLYIQLNRNFTADSAVRINLSK